VSTSVPPTPLSLNVELIPPDPGLINPDLALDAALAPVEDLTTDVPSPFGRSWRFDFVAGQFVKEGTVPKVVYELDTLIMWVEKTLRTARTAHPIYEEEYGVDEPMRLVGVPLDDAETQAWQESATAALLVHDRIVDVSNFSYSQDPFEETLLASFTVLIDAAPPLGPQSLEFQNIPVAQT